MNGDLVLWIAPMYHWNALNGKVFLTGTITTTLWQWWIVTNVNSVQAVGDLNNSTTLVLATVVGALILPNMMETSPFPFGMCSLLPFLCRHWPCQRWPHANVCFAHIHFDGELDQAGSGLGLYCSNGLSNRRRLKEIRGGWIGHTSLPADLWQRNYHHHHHHCHHHYHGEPIVLHDQT